MFEKRLGIRISMVAFTMMFFHGYLLFMVLPFGSAGPGYASLGYILGSFAFLQFISSFMILGWSKAGVQLCYFSWGLLGSLLYMLGWESLWHVVVLSVSAIGILHLFVFGPKWQNFE